MKNTIDRLHKTSSIKLSLVVLLGAASIMAACSGADDGGVAGDIKLTEMTVEQANSLCQFALDQVDLDDMAKGSCYSASILASKLDPNLDCEATAQECVKNPTQGVKDLLTCTANQAILSGLPACAANLTTDDWKVCQIAFNEALATLAANVSCTTEVTKLPNPATFSECSTIKDECPELFELAM
ncbi:MAG: hypothetical protein MJE77_45830 [Proteobacteria bacterium]|nr:hypothetical protein [Pseudomonadota bacterium]